NDDLGASQALAVVHGHVREGNSALTAGSKEQVAEYAGELRTMLGVLGIDPLDPQRAGGDEQGLHEVVDALVTIALEQRQAARKRKDYTAADTIRDQIADTGDGVEDTPQGARWERRQSWPTVFWKFVARSGRLEHPAGRSALPACVQDVRGGLPMPAKRHKKGPTKGSGGKHRRALEGKSSTLPAEQRHWYEDKQRAKAAKRPKPSPRAEQRPRTERRQRKVDSDLLVGRNPVVEALRAGMPATRLFLVNSLDPDNRVTEAARLAGDQGVDVVEVNRTDLDRRCESNGQPDAVHQGIALQTRP